jgi:hypothetical protein
MFGRKSRKSKLILAATTSKAVAYCPPGTEHDVVNTGAVPLRYIYLVAKPR